MPTQNRRNRAKRMAGFVITLEFLLVVSLVVIPLAIGAVLVGRKLVTLYLTREALLNNPLSRPVVWDASPKPMGEVIGYDPYGAPLILYRDNTTGVTQTPGVLLGVRSERLTTVSKVYYFGNAACLDTGNNVYVKSASATLASTGWPSVGYMYQLQGWNYAMGSGNVLYRGPAPPPVAEGFGLTVLIGSVWSSQDTGDPSPESGGTACSPLGANVSDLQAATEVADLDDGSNFARPFGLAFIKVQ